MSATGRSQARIPPRNARGGHRMSAPASAAAPTRGPRALGAAWARLAARERRLVLLAAAVLGLALLWLLAVAPALRTLRQAEAQRATLAAQTEQLQRLRAEAQALQALPRLGHDEALRALESSVRQRLGDSAQLSVVGERATLVLRQASAEALAQWLADARANARANTVEARLTRAGDNAPGAPVRWNGTLTLALP